MIVSDVKPIYCQNVLNVMDNSGYVSSGMARTFRPCRLSIFCNLNRRLVCLQHIVSVQQPMKMVIQDGKIAVYAQNRPVCHILRVQVYVTSIKISPFRIMAAVLPDTIP